MAGISATDFTQGPELFDQEKYQSLVSISIEPNPQTIEADFQRPLAERIIGPINTSGIYDDYRLDDVIVRVPSAAFRQHEVNQWTRAKKEAEDKQWGWTVTAIGSLVVAAVGGLSAGEVLGAAVSPVAPFIIAAGVLAAIVTAVLAGIAHSAAGKALEQMNKWSEEPTMKVAKARQFAHEQGFPYIYSNNLKLGREFSATGRFHPKHVEHEYRKYFADFCKKMLSESCNSCKVTWMEKFSSMNPLSSKLMIYGLGEVPERMAQVIADYDRLDSFLKDIRSSYADLKTRETEIANDRIALINREREEKLRPYTDARNTALETAKAQRDRIFRDHPLETDRAHQDAKRNYEAIKRSLDDDFSLRSGPINKDYDARVKEVEQDRDTRIQRIDSQKFQQLSNNYNAARDLLIRAERAWRGEQTYQPVNFQQYFPWQAAPAQPVYYGQPAMYYPAQPAYPVMQAGYVQPPTYFAG